MARKLAFFVLFFLPLIIRSFVGNTRNLVLIEFKQGWVTAAAHSVQQNFNERMLPIGSRGNLKASEKGREPRSIFAEGVEETGSASGPYRRVYDPVEWENRVPATRRFPISRAPSRINGEGGN